MRKSTIIYVVFFLFPFYLIGQVQYVLPVSDGKNGAVTATANDWEAIGVNPANLGWDNNDKISFTILNLGVNGQSGGMSLKNVHTLLTPGDTNQPEAGKQVFGSTHGTNLFADINWFAFSMKIDKLGTFAINLQDKAIFNMTVSPGGASLFQSTGRLPDSVILNKLNGGSSISLVQYREFNLNFGREICEWGGDENDDYYMNYNVRYLQYMGQGTKSDTAPKSDNKFRLYGGIGLKYIWGGAYFNGQVVNTGINADYSLPGNFPSVSLQSTPGHGLATDIGLSGTYKKWTFGLSATDLGSITWHQSSFTIADTSIYGLNNPGKVIDKLDSNKVVDFKQASDFRMPLPSKLRLGAAYQATNHVGLSADIILPLNHAFGNLAGPYAALGTNVNVGKVLIINMGVAATKYYGVSVPLGFSLCAGHPVQMYFGTSDILTYLGRANNGSISVAYGLIRINIAGKKKSEAGK